MKSGKWELDPQKFLTQREAMQLLAGKEIKTKAWAEVIVRDRFISNLGLSTGLRVMEIAALKCDDLNLEARVPYLVVRKGKGGKRRRVFFNHKFRNRCKEYLAWKQEIGESIKSDQPLLLSTRTGGHLTTRAIQKAFKRCAKRAGLSENYSIHSLRHSYACFLYKASNWNLRLVQKQLGHARITTTQVYADIMNPDLEKALNRLDF